MPVKLTVEDVVPRLAPVVARFRQGPFALQDDLERLVRVCAVEAPEASVLYCCRVLEFLAADALRAVGLYPEKRVAADLDALHQFGLVPPPTLAWAHALRRTGNAARHIRRRIQESDVDLAMVFLERWLTWFFCRFRYRPLLPGLTGDGGPLWAVGQELRGVLAAMEEPGLPAKAMFERLLAQGERSVLYCSPTLPAVLAEAILDGGDPDHALEVLKPALRRFGDDLRLQQLLGLYHSRTGRHDDALKVLGPLRASRPHEPEDCETEGILAGVFKRQGRLDDCHRAYAAGWEGSGWTNFYLGINAATTALWLDRHEAARAIAAQVRNGLAGRLATLARRGDRAELVLNYWDQATLAEAHLLLGELEPAGRAYGIAFTRYADQKNNHLVTRAQAERILDKLGLSSHAPEVLG